MLRSDGMTNICLMGLGRTGTESPVLYLNSDMKLVAAVCSDFSSKYAKDVGEILGIPETGARVYTVSQLEEVILEHDPDIIVDFKCPGYHEECKADIGDGNWPGGGNNGVY